MCVLLLAMCVTQPRKTQSFITLPSGLCFHDVQIDTLISAACASLVNYNSNESWLVKKSHLQWTLLPVPLLTYLQHQPRPNSYCHVASLALNTTYNIFNEHLLTDILLWCVFPKPRHCLFVMLNIHISSYSHAVSVTYVSYRHHVLKP